MPGYPYPPDKPRDEDTPTDDGTFVLKRDLELVLDGFGNEQYGDLDEERAAVKRLRSALNDSWR